MYINPNNIIEKKSYDFGVNIVKLFAQCSKEYNNAVLLRQLLRSGTSVGANIQEATGGFSKKEFIVKVQIAYKEARESLYWLNLLNDSDILKIEDLEKLIDDCTEIIKIITKILKTSKNNG